MTILTKEIDATTSHGEEDAFDDGLPIDSHLYVGPVFGPMEINAPATHGAEEASEGSLDQGLSSSLQDSLAAQDETSRIRQN